MRSLWWSHTSWCPSTTHAHASNSCRLHLSYTRLGILLGCFSGLTRHALQYASTNNHLFRNAQFSTFTHLELLILTQQPVRIQYLQVCVKVDVGGFSTLPNFRAVDMGGVLVSNKIAAK